MSECLIICITMSIDNITDFDKVYKARIIAHEMQTFFVVKDTYVRWTKISDQTVSSVL